MTRSRVVLLVLGLVVLGLFSGVLWWYFFSGSPVPPPEQSLPREDIHIYLLDPLEYQLVLVSRTVPAAQNQSERVQQVIDEMKTVSDTSPLVTLLPEPLQLRSVFLGDQTVYLDFNDAFLGAAQGSSGEMMFLYSIVNSVLDNLPNQYKLVQFLVEGEMRKTMGAYGEESGHIAIQYPLGPRWELVKPAT